MTSTIRSVATLCGLLAAPSPLLADGPADAIYAGGVIVTVDPARPTAEAVAVLGGKVVAVGGREAVLGGWRGAGTKVVDLEGRTMVPGFVGTQGHFMGVVEGANRANAAGRLVGPAKDVAEAELLANLKRAEGLDASRGYTTVVVAPLEGPAIALCAKGAERGLLALDLIGYAGRLEFPELIARGTEFAESYRNHLKWPAGVMIAGDGPAEAKAAFFTRPYLTGGPGGQVDWRGVPSITPDSLEYLVRLAYDHNVPVEYLANGDAAIDRLLEAHEAAGAPEGRRTTVIGSQFVRPDQLDKYVEHGLIPSFSTDHAFSFGDAHVKDLGEARAFALSPMKTARAKGLRASNHAAVTPAGPIFAIWTAVNRTSRSGRVIGPAERVTPLDALKAVTIDAAHQHFEDATKGSIEPGKLADLVILSHNPLTVDPASIADIRVLETIKEGKTVYRKVP